MTVEQVRSLGCIPYAVYGGRVYSYKKKESDIRVWPIEMLRASQGRLRK